MEESELALESKAARMANGSYSLNDSAGKVSTEVKNGEGDARQEIKIFGEGKESSIEVKAAVETEIVDDFKDDEDNKDVKYGEENNIVKEIINVDENKDVGVTTKVVEEKKANKALNGEEKEDRETKNRDVKNDLEKAKAGGDKKVVEIQGINDMKVLLEANDTEENIVGEEVEDVGDKKALEAMEDVKDNNERNGVGDVKANGEKNEDKGSHLIDGKGVEELKNGKGVEELKDGKDEEGTEEMKDDEHSKALSVEKYEGKVLILIEGDVGDKTEKAPKDVEMVDAEHVVENEVTDVKEEGELSEREGEEKAVDDEGSAGKDVYEKKAGSLKRKRHKGQRMAEKCEPKEKGEGKEELEVKETKESGKKTEDVLSTPVVSSGGRPVRERKTVERLVEVIEKGPNTALIIEKGRGTPLKEIPNVAYKLARKKPSDLKFLHQTLFGRKGKAVNYKSNLLQFSGFAWHESEDKQRTKMKERLDKCVKENLFGLCNFFDLTVSKANTKKDDIIVKLLDFLEAPHANSGVILAEKEQSSKSRKRKRTPKLYASNSSGGKPEKRSAKKRAKIEGTPNSKGKYLQDSGDDDDDEDEGEDYGTDSPCEDEVPRHSESGALEKELEEEGDDEEDEKEEFDDFREEKKEVKKSPKQKEREEVKKSPKKQGSAVTEKKSGSSSKKSSSKINVKSPAMTPSSINPKVEKSDAGEKVFSRKKRGVESPKKLNSKSNSKENSFGEKAVKSKAKLGEEQKSGPSKAELRKTICQILKEVDFNTATFTDILKKLAADYKTDLTPKKGAIKLMIQEELTKMTDEAEDSEDEGDEDDDCKKENPQPTGKKMQS